MATTQGKWVIKNLKIDQDNVPANISIPVTLSYKNANPVSFNVTKSALTVQTEWYTNIVDGQGVEISPNDIKITNGGSVTCGETKYQLTSASTWNWEIIPVGGGSSSSLTIRYTGSQVSALSGTTSAFSITAQNATVTGYTVNNGASITASGASSVTVSYPANQNGTQPKTYTVIVKGKDSNNNLVSGSTTFTQSADSNYTFTLSPASTTVEATDTGKTFSVTATNITSVGYASSLSSGLTGGTANSTSATAKFSQNSSDSYVDKTFVITGKTETGRVVQAQASIRQNGSSVQPNLSISSTATTTPVDASGASVVLVVSSNTGWTLSVAQAAQEYASITSPTGSGNANKTLTVYPNNGADQRNIRVYARTTDGSIERYIDIKQTGVSPELEISAQTTNVAATGGSIAIKITSNTGWTVSSNQTWATFSESTTDSGTKTKTLTVESYDGDASREVIITVTGGGLTKSVTITQNGNYYLKFWDTDRGNLDNLAWDQGGRIQVHVDANVEWMIFATESWVHIKDNSGQPFTGASGNQMNIYITVDNNETGLDRDASLTIAATDTSLGVADDSIPVHQKKEEPKFAIFKDKVISASGETAYELSGITVSANTFWYIDIPVSTDWIAAGRDCSGNDTSELPGGVQAIYLNISPNPTISERSGVVKILGSGNEYDTLAITQGRGLSTIDIDGTATEVIFSGQTVQFTVESNQNWHVISYGNRLIPSGFTTSTAFHSGTTTIAFTVPENTGDTSIDYTVTVKTDDNVTYAVEDSYSFSQGAKPPKNGTLYAWFENDASESGTRHLVYEHDVPPASGNSRPARSASDTDWLANPFTFYMRSNTTNSVVSVECFSLTTSSGSSYKLVTAGTLSDICQIYDNNGNEITCGSTAGQWFGPTIPGSGDTWVPFTIHLPANRRTGGKVGGARRFIIKFKTFDYWNWQPLPGDLDFNWHDSLKIEIDQYGNDCYTDGYEIYAFMFGNMQQLDETATTIPAYVEGTPGTAANCYYPAVIINGQKHCTAYQGTTTEMMEDYIKLNGNLPYTDPAVLELVSDTGRPTIKYENWSVIQYPEANKPFEVYVPANTGYTATGATKEFDLTLTYKTAIPAISKTIHVTQEYAQVEPETLPLYLYVQSMYGGQASSVTEDNVNLLQSDRTVRFGLNGSFAEGEIMYYVNGDTSKFTGQCIFGHDYFDAQTGNTQGDSFYNNSWPGHTFDAIFKVKNTVTSDFDIVITGQKVSDPMVKVNLTLHVKV